MFSFPPQPNDVAGLLLLIATVLLLSAFLVGVYRLLARRWHWFDVPNQRSSHTVATPRGAGVVIVLLYLLALIDVMFDGALAQATSSTAQWLFMVPVAVGCIGAVDDILVVNAKLRLFLYLLASATLCLLMLPTAETVLVNIPIIDQWLLLILVAVALTWLINLYNFMDGINGIVALEFIFVVVAAALMVGGLVNPVVTALLAVVIGAVVGFLLWNFPLGKVFLGDAGSTFLGSVLALCILYSGVQGWLSPWVWLILLACFVVDATVTLLTRMVLRQQWWQAHRSHAYQILARRLGSHAKVVGLVMAVNGVWLLPLAQWAYIDSQVAALVFVLACAPLALVCVLLGAGRNNG